MDIRSEVKNERGQPKDGSAFFGDQKSGAVGSGRGAAAAERKIFEANQKDLEAAAESGLPQSVQKRLKFDAHKLADVISGIKELVKLPDPLSQVQLSRQLDDHLNLYRVTCPIGVIGIILRQDRMLWCRSPLFVSRAAIAQF